jgi:hypothetical protein
MPKVKAMSDVCLPTGLSGFFFGSEIAKVKAPAVYGYSGAPFFAALAPNHAANARNICLVQLLVLAVLGPRYQPQVGKPVVGSIAVDMVNLGWIDPVSHLPNQAMRYMELTENTPRGIALGVWPIQSGPIGKSDIPSLAGRFLPSALGAEHFNGARLPRQAARLRVIGQQIAQNFRRWYRAFSHDRTSHVRLWLGLNECCKHRSARLFSHKLPNWSILTAANRALDAAPGVRQLSLF